MQGAGAIASFSARFERPSRALAAATVTTGVTADPRRLPQHEWIHSARAPGAAAFVALYLAAALLLIARLAAHPLGG